MYSRLKNDRKTWSVKCPPWKNVFFSWYAWSRYARSRVTVTGWKMTGKRDRWNAHHGRMTRSVIRPLIDAFTWLLQGHGFSGVLVTVPAVPAVPAGKLYTTLEETRMLTLVNLYRKMVAFLNFFKYLRFKSEHSHFYVSLWSFDDIEHAPSCSNPRWNQDTRSSGRNRLFSGKVCESEVKVDVFASTINLTATKV